MTQLIVQNGEAAPEYQALLLELEALSHALRQLETLQPTPHELLQLGAIKKTATLCLRPLQEFMAKISKFEARLGTNNSLGNRFKGFPRRMQWTTMYRDDMKELRSALGSHVSTINMLLMTQTLGSISAAERGREEAATKLEKNMLSHGKLLEDVKHGQSEIKSQLRDHKVVLNSLGSKAESSIQLQREQLSVVKDTQAQTTSVLATATDVLSLTTSGLMNLQLITKQLGRMFQLSTEFTTEMTETMGELMRLFTSLHTTFRKLEAALPAMICPPIIQFTDALGETMALPYQLCQQWETFQQMLKVVFAKKQGKTRVEMGQFFIMFSADGALIKKTSWSGSIKRDDHLSMSMILDHLEATEGWCPFPSCQASTKGVSVQNGGRTCPVCGCWAAISPRMHSGLLKPHIADANDDERFPPITDSSSSTELSLDEKVEGEEEDVHLYRQIHVRSNIPASGHESLDGYSSVGTHVNEWLLDQLRNSALGVNLLVRTFEGQFGNTDGSWEASVLATWYDDGTVDNKTLYPVHSVYSSMTTQAPLLSDHSSSSAKYGVTYTI